jgi:hypothetical protein
MLEKSMQITSFGVLSKNMNSLKTGPATYTAALS